VITSAHQVSTRAAPMFSGALVDRVRHRLAAAGAEVTPGAVAAAVRAESDGVLADLQVLSALRELQQELVGAGPLEPLLADPDTTDVLVNAPEEVWVEQAGQLRRTEVRFADADAVRRLAQRLALAAGRRLDDASPYVDAPLPGGVRLHAVLPPIATGCTCISLRVLRQTTHGLDALQQVGSVSPEAGRLLRAIVTARLAFLVVGGTGSGNTTLRLRHTYRVTRIHPTGLRRGRWPAWFDDDEQSTPS
jgi:pilus assembly protein CpaF